MPIYIYQHKRIYIYRYTYTHMYCIYVYMYIHIHTHIYIYWQSKCLSIQCYVFSIDPLGSIFTLVKLEQRLSKHMMSGFLPTKI